MLVLATTFVITFIIGTPIAFCLGIAGILELMFSVKASPMVAATKMYTSLDSFPLLAIPLFILMGHLMESCGVLSRLINFLSALLGPIRGGMAYINVLTSMLFAGVSGTATADVSSMGYIEIRMMERCGFRRDFSAALTAASAVVGPIIPPSLAMVVFALAVGGGVSIGGLFMAGVVPGTLMGLFMIALSYLYISREEVSRTLVTYPRVGVEQIITLTIEALPILFLPFVVLGGILLGVFTVTEAAAVGVVYSLIIGFAVTRELHFKDIPLAIVRSAIITGSIAILFGAGNTISWILAINHIPRKVAEGVMSLTTDPIIFLLLTMGIMIVMGCVMEPNAAIILLGPILFPIAIQLGIHPFQFGLVFIMTVEIGLLTPPVGVLLFITSGIGNIDLYTLVRHIWPFVLCQLFVVLLAVFVPEITAFVPRLFRF